MTDKTYENLFEAAFNWARLFLYPFAIRWLWKILVIPIFKLDPITYWQALGLMILVGLIDPNSSDLLIIKKRLQRLLDRKN